MNPGKRESADSDMLMAPVNRAISTSTFMSFTVGLVLLLLQKTAKVALTFSNPLTWQRSIESNRRQKVSHVFWRLLCAFTYIFIWL